MYIFHFLIESVFDIRQRFSHVASFSLYACTQCHFPSHAINPCFVSLFFFSGRFWQFPLVAEVSEGDSVTRYNYQPKSDFSFSLGDIPIMILEVCSDKQADKESESDRPRLLIQATCLTRLWNHLLGGREMVIMAVYVERDLIVSRYLFFQGNGPNSAPVRCLFIESALRSHPNAG
jgi:hypothetical protein